MTRAAGKKTTEASIQAVAKIRAGKLQKKIRKKVRKQKKNTTFHRITKNMRSIHSSEKIEEMICELEGYRCDAVLLNETWRPDRSNIWETHHKHVFMGSGKYGNKHAEQEVATKYHRHRAHQRASHHHNVDFGQPTMHQADERVHSPLWVCRPPRRKILQNNRETHCRQELHSDCNVELGPGCGVECWSVGIHTLNEGNKRGDWMKQWLMLQNFTALNTMYRQTLGKQTTYRSPKGTEKANRPHLDQEKTHEIQ